MHKVTVELRSGTKISLRSSIGRRNTDLTVLAENLYRDQYRLKKIARDDMVVVDIGAHIGIFAVVCASLCPDSRIYAYEPERANFALLEENAQLNAGQRIFPLNKAVAGERDTLKLFVSDRNSGAHTTLGTVGDYQEVACVSLGDVMADLPEKRVDLLKLDCEGREYDILTKLDDDDLGRIDRILMETHHTENTRDHDWDGLCKRLRKNGFIVNVYDTSYLDDGTTHLVSAVRPEHTDT